MMESKFIWKCVATGVYLFLSSSASNAVPVVDKDLTEAQSLYRNAQSSEAVSLCEKKIAAGKNLPQWHELLAKTLNMNRGGSARAEDEIQKALKAAPHDENIIATTGFVTADRGANVGQFIPKIQEAIKNHPKNGRLHAALSDCLDATHNPLSDSEIILAIKLEPNDFDVNAQAISHYTKLQKVDEIYKAYERMLKGSPKSAYAYAERGLFERDNYKFAQSSQDLQKAIELNPKYTAAYAMLAKSLKKGAKYPEAIKVINAMLASGGPSPNLLGRRAYCYSHTKQLDKAINDYDQAITIYGKGTAFIPQKPHDKMAEDPRLDYNKYWLERVECREQAGQIDQGLNELTAYIAGAAHPDSAYEIRQRLYRRKGQYDKALTDLNYLIKKDAFVGERYSARAEVLNKLGRAAEAKQDLKHAENIESTGSP